MKTTTVYIKHVLTNQHHKSRRRTALYLPIFFIKTNEPFSRLTPCTYIHRHNFILTAYYYRFIKLLYSIRNYRFCDVKKIVSNCNILYKVPIYQYCDGNVWRENFTLLEQ